LRRIIDAKQKLEQALKDEAQDKQAMAAKLTKVLTFVANSEFYDIVYDFTCWTTNCHREKTVFVHSMLALSEGEFICELLRVVKNTVQRWHR